MNENSPSKKRSFSRRASCLTVMGGSLFAFIGLILAAAYWPAHWPAESAQALAQMRSDMATAEARWQQSALKDYDIDVRISIHPGCAAPLGAGALTLQVRDGQLVPNEFMKAHGLEISCPVGWLLPPQAFAYLREAIEQAQPEQNYLSVQFDAEYGFVSKYSLTSNSRSADLYVVYEFSNFQPITTAR